MSPRERLLATLRGDPVDRPAVCFYELNGLEDRSDADPFNIHSDPSWRPLLDLTRDRTDRIAMASVPFRNAQPDPVDALTERNTWLDERGSRFTRTVVRAGRRPLTRLTRRDRDIDTVWTLEHPVKDADDFRAWIDLPQAWAGEAGGEPDTSGVLGAERALGDRGIAMIDTPDPLCLVAELFDMGEYTITAMNENELMHRALQKAASWLLPRCEAVSAALPGRLWRIYGPEYAAAPYLPPRLFAEYVTRYAKPIVDAIHRHGGYARIHCHGRIKDILGHIAATGCDGLDPIEPPPQGDVTLRHAREKAGGQMVLFGNIEVSDIENLPTPEFAKKIETALREGAEGKGRGFVLMPSACPCGRKLSGLALANYEKMVEMVEALA
jgi:hypothetical protein